jgi:hypothetical protein
MASSTIKLTTHVGRDLLASAGIFKSEQAVVWEYVVNALQYVDDGVSPRVNVTVSPREKRIEISDNGRGMSEVDLKRFFTMHGENADRQRGRPGRGKFGTGKSAAFGIANELVVDTRREGVRNRIRLTRKAIDESTGSDVPLDWQIRNEATDLPNGTTISIEGVVLPRISATPIVEYIERNLQVFRKRHPEVAVNDHVCQHREPEVAESFEFRPTSDQAKVLGEVVLHVSVARSPLSESEVGVAVTSGVGALVGVETGGIERKEFGNYLFGEIDCPAIEQSKSTIEPYDASRNLQLNIRHPVCAALIPFMASKLEEVRVAQVRKLQEARKSEQARRLEREASKIADILNKDFDTIASRLDGIRSASVGAARAAARFGSAAEAGAGQDAHVEGVSVPASVEKTDGSRRTDDGRGRDAPNVPKRATPNEAGESAADPSGGTGHKSRPRGGFRVEYRPLGDKEYRSKYDPSTLTILINLDHPAVKNALVASSGNTEDVSFRRLSYELAFTEYSLALGFEMANRDPGMPADDVLYEIRVALNRVSVAAADLYAQISQ